MAAGMTLRRAIVRKRAARSRPILAACRTATRAASARGRRATMSEPARTAMAITLTEPAANKVRSLIAEQGSPEGTGLRVKVVGGGCSGMSYQLALESSPTPADKVFESHGIKVYLDPKSALFVNGTEIDWQESMMGAAFSFKNPQAKGTCGCGTSFTA